MHVQFHSSWKKSSQAEGNSWHFWVVWRWTSNSWLEICCLIDLTIMVTLLHLGELIIILTGGFVLCMESSFIFCSSSGTHCSGTQGCLAWRNCGGCLGCLFTIFWAGRVYWKVQGGKNGCNIAISDMRQTLCIFQIPNENFLFPDDVDEYNIFFPINLLSKWSYFCSFFQYWSYYRNVVGQLSYHNLTLKYLQLLLHQVAIKSLPLAPEIVLFQVLHTA